MMGRNDNVPAHFLFGSGSAVASGVYFYRLTAGGRSITRKMILMK